ncbi:MAG: [FeFe] hydrogenase H-cluster maturation GTPase HydF [Anaerovoracaceae bacterium]
MAVTGLNDTPSGERLHIGFFGRRNAGKSSIVNAVTGQDLAVVSDTKGTTTDPVMKAMELLPIGAVMIIDTPGFDDEGKLGELRVKKTRQILNRTDVAVLVIDISEGMGAADRQLIEIFKERAIPYIIAWNKYDLADDYSYKKSLKEMKTAEDGKIVYAEIYVSAVKNININELKELIAQIGKGKEPSACLVSDLVSMGDIVILVIPIDESAPKGRIILPQQQVLRELLDSGAAAMCVRDTELKSLIDDLKVKPAMVITDSQVFGSVSEIVPRDIPLTSFSILMARYKGFLETAVKGIATVENLSDGDKVLISEGCTHHRQCNDIGTVKIPKWLSSYTDKKVFIETSSGRDFPEDLSEYALVIHCGGCMLTEKDMVYRMKCAENQNIPFTNYGITIAYTQGILERSISVFPQLSEILNS